MKQNNVRAEFESTAVLGAQSVREFLSYKGKDRNFFNKARVGAAAMSSYARLRATMANEDALRVASGGRPSFVLDVVPERKRLGR